VGLGIAVVPTVLTAAAHIPSDTFDDARDEKSSADRNEKREQKPIMPSN
jgi:hypothetical protein